VGENERGGFRRTRARSPVLSRDAVVQGRSPDILVKPIDPALRTNLSSIRPSAPITSSCVWRRPPTWRASADPIRRTSWSRCGRTRSLPPLRSRPESIRRSDFAYRLSGANPPWKPVQVFERRCQDPPAFPRQHRAKRVAAAVPDRREAQGRAGQLSCVGPLWWSTGCSRSNSGSARISSRSSGSSGRAAGSGTCERGRRSRVWLVSGSSPQPEPIATRAAPLPSRWLSRRALATGIGAPPVTNGAVAASPSVDTNTSVSSGLGLQRREWPGWRASAIYPPV